MSRQSAHEGGKVVTPMHWLHLPPRKYSWYLLLLEAEDLRTTVQPKGLCQWKIRVTPLWIKSMTFWFVIHCLNQLHHHVPWHNRYRFKLKPHLLCFFQLQTKYDDDIGTVKLRTQELEAEQNTLLKDKQLLTSEAEELKNKFQVFRKHAVNLTPNITTEWLHSMLEFSVMVYTITLITVFVPTYSVW